ncbi:hypothetical protein VP01_1869g3 [Puccinia sorghi]|uniref:C2H2-type domain-containing protein n=1 Tax=Puccinia sorghi TaxID=27349 RepID=A0A0L6VDV2_9BASI|nr:hypothetical protein VP01_1869g3 [Puccinia sorghi]
MRLAMITNQTNLTPKDMQRPLDYCRQYHPYSRSPGEVVTYEDDFDRHPSRHKRVRLDEEKIRADQEETPDGLDRNRWSNLQPDIELGRASREDYPLTIGQSTSSLKPEEEEAEGQISPACSLYSSAESTITLSHSSQRSSPLQPATPERKPQAFQFPSETYSSGPGTESLSTSTVESPPGAWTNDSRRLPQPPESHISPSYSHPPQPPRPNHQPPSLTSLVQDKPYKCSLCPKSFTRNYDLTRHKSSHIDQRLHRCSKCGRSFNRRDALIRHTLVKSCGLVYS